MYRTNSLPNSVLQLALRCVIYSVTPFCGGIKQCKKTLTPPLKEILKYFSNQVSPSDLETVLMQHPGVGNVCVVFVPDALAGDLPAAVIVKSKTTDVSEDDIISLMKAKLSDAKQLLGGIFFVDELPVTPFGKVFRRKVLEVAQKYHKERSANAK